MNCRKQFSHDHLSTNPTFIETTVPLAQKHVFVLDPPDSRTPSPNRPFGPSWPVQRLPSEPTERYSGCINEARILVVLKNGQIRTFLTLSL